MKRAHRGPNLKTGQAAMEAPDTQNRIGARAR